MLVPGLLISEDGGNLVEYRLKKNFIPNYYFRGLEKKNIIFWYSFSNFLGAFISQIYAVFP